MPTMDQFLHALGACTMIYWGLRIGKFWLQMWQESLGSKPVDFRKYGKWAVVTGASEGIGKGVATALAKCKLNVVLISRTKSKLEKIAEELRESFNVEIKIIAIDFTAGDVIYDIIREEIEDLDIAVLVNNVGLAWLDPTPHLDIPNKEKYSTDAIRVNIDAMLKLTEMVLPNMVKKKGGIVANISSVIGVRSNPYYAAYGACKSYVTTYTLAMAEEYKSKGVIFQCISPGITATAGLADKIKSNAMIPSGDLFGQYAVKAIGKSVYTNTGFFWHNVLQKVMLVMPDFLYAKVQKGEAEKAFAERMKNQK